MRRIEIILSLVVLTACGSTDLRNLFGEHLAERESKKILYIPDSYEAIETVVDSAILSTHNDPIILTTAEEIYNIKENIFNIREPFKKIEQLESKIRKRAAELEYGKFIGWEVRHRFRAKDNDGRVDILDMLYICDKRFNDNYFTASLNNDDDRNYYDLTYLIDEITADEGTSLIDFMDAERVEAWSEDISEIVSEIETESLNIIEDVKKTASDVKQEIETTYGQTIEDVKKISKVIKTETQEAISEIESELTEVIPQEINSTEAEVIIDDYFEYETNNNTIDSNTLLELNNF